MSHVITIDGPAGSGKSTIAKLLAKKIGWTYVTTGSLYRSFAFLLQKYPERVDEDTIQKCISDLIASYHQDPISGRIFLSNVDVTDQISSPEISQLASIYAKDENIRTQLLPLQRQIATKNKGVVIEGRDMGTVVFPDALLKIFLTASPEERAKRRFDEFKKVDEKIKYNDVLAQIKERDIRDENRSVAPLKPASDAVILDSTGKTREDILNSILALVKEKKITT